MSWKIEIKPTAEKSYLKLDKKTRIRIKRSLLELAKSENPLMHPNVRPLIGKLRGDCRLRVGDWRVLFTPEKDQKIIQVYAILPRGTAY
jgi:mRNA-degrading endonuclease RelE of RelBE toxin-antitoxin system